MTKLDAPHTTFSIREDLQTVGNIRKAAGANLQEPKDEPVISPVHSLQQSTEAKTIGNDGKDEESAAATSTSLDDFLDAISSMPSHQHVGSARAGRQSRNREETGREQMSSASSALDPPRLALRKKLRDSSPIRKFTWTRHEKGNPQGPRIYKHGVKMPLLLGPRLSDAARRAVIKGWTHQYGQEPLANSETEIGPDAPVLHRNHDRWELEERAQARLENEADTELTGPEIRFVADASKNPLPRSEPISTSHDVSTDRERALHGEVVRKLRVSGAPQVKVRKHMAVRNAIRTRLDSESQHDKIKAVGESDQLEEDPRRIKSSNWFREDLSSHRPQAEINVPMLHIQSHLSHEAAPKNAREKARRLHREYHLPLLNQQAIDIPRP